MNIFIILAKKHPCYKISGTMYEIAYIVVCSFLTWRSKYGLNKPGRMATSRTIPLADRKIYSKSILDVQSLLRNFIERYRNYRYSSVI